MGHRIRRRRIRCRVGRCRWAGGALVHVCALVGSGGARHAGKPAAVSVLSVLPRPSVPFVAVALVGERGALPVPRASPRVVGGDVREGSEAGRIAVAAVGGVGFVVTKAGGMGTVVEEGGFGVTGGTQYSSDAVVVPVPRVFGGDEFGFLGEKRARVPGRGRCHGRRRPFPRRRIRREGRPGSPCGILTRRRRRRRTARTVRTATRIAALAQGTAGGRGFDHGVDIRTRVESL